MQLPNYAKCLNNWNKDDSGWKSTFVIYFGRKSNELVNAGLTYDGENIMERKCSKSFWQGR